MEAQSIRGYDAGGRPGAAPQTRVLCLPRSVSLAFARLPMRGGADRRAGKRPPKAFAAGLAAGRTAMGGRSQVGGGIGMTWPPGRCGLRTDLNRRDHLVLHLEEPAPEMVSRRSSPSVQGARGRSPITCSARGERRGRCPLVGGCGSTGDNSAGTGARAAGSPGESSSAPPSAPPLADRRAARRRALKRVVRSYYADIAAGNYRVAWHRRAPGVQSSFGGYTSWRAG
jgi:hypothetical protein